MALGVFVVLLAAACGRGVATPQGDPVAAQRAAEAETRQQQPRAAQGQQPAQPDLLSADDLSAAYQQILTSYVDRVDHATLIDAAASAVRDTVIGASALPIDTAPMDLLPLTTGNPGRDWAAFRSAYDGVVQRHPEWSLQARPDYAAARRMVAALNDSHSAFLTAAEARRQAETSYSGIGIFVRRLEPEAPPVVGEVFPSSPAEQAGLRAGDRILAVGEERVDLAPLGQVADLIRGPQNSEVTLHIERTGAGASTVRVVRRPLAVPVADGQVLDGRIGYIKIRGFGETTAERVGRLLIEQRQAGAQAWILDLRGNPGGDVVAGARVAGYFLDTRTIGIAVDRSGQRQPIVAERRPFTVRAPLVALIDRNTASISEVLAAAFREYQAATVVGQQSAGSVGMSESRPLSDGSVLQITVRRLFSPSGVQLDGTGVQPDQAVTLSPADLEDGRDPQRDEAIRILSQQSAARG